MGRKWSGDNAALWVIASLGILHFIVLKYIPMLGNVIAFQNYNIFQGIRGSPWVGFTHFVNMAQYTEFAHIVTNTLLLGLYSIVFGFPAPLFLAILLNELARVWLKKTVQTMLYLPHFLSWIIVGGIFINLLDLEGFINAILLQFNVKPIYFLAEPAYFRSIVTSIGIWKEVGWGMIIYLAALAGINPNLYEAATVEGAGRWQQMRYVTLPCLMPAIVVLLLLRIGHLLDSNVEQVLVFLNPLVRDVGEVVDTYVYRVGLLGSQFSYSTAIGLFKSVIGFILIVGLNRLSKHTTGESIY